MNRTDTCMASSGTAMSPVSLPLYLTNGHRRDRRQIVPLLYDGGMQTSRNAAMMMTRLRLIGILCMLGAGASAWSKGPDAFVFGGFSLFQTPEQVTALYPGHPVEVDKEATRRSIVVRGKPGDFADQVTYAQWHIYAGKIEKLVLNFERPLPAGKDANYFRSPLRQHPPCAALLPVLKKRFGKPSGRHSWTTEEEMRMTAYVWEKPDQGLIFTCARFKGDASVFIDSLVINATSSCSSNQNRCQTEGDKRK